MRVIIDKVPAEAKEYELLTVTFCASQPLELDSVGVISGRRLQVLTASWQITAVGLKCNPPLGVPYARRFIHGDGIETPFLRIYT